MTQEATTLDLDSGNWITTKDAATLLHRSERVVQEWGKEGKLTRRPHPNNPRTFAYDRSEVEQIAAITQTVRRTQHEKPETETGIAVHRASLASKKGAVSAFASVLENMQQAYLARLEAQAALAAKTLENVVAQIFAERQAERDAERYRFDCERADRAARLKQRRAQKAKPGRKPRA